MLGALLEVTSTNLFGQVCLFQLAPRLPSRRVPSRLNDPNRRTKGYDGLRGTARLNSFEWDSAPDLTGEAFAFSP
jgi:hypothetical protein